MLVLTLISWTFLRLRVPAGVGVGVASSFKEGKIIDEYFSYVDLRFSACICKREPRGFDGISDVSLLVLPISSPIGLKGTFWAWSLSACATSMTVGRLPVLGVRDSLPNEATIGEDGAEADFLTGGGKLLNSY